MDDTLSHAIALFHRGEYWECHEALEAPWRLLPAESAERHLLQGVIQIAAGCLKLEAGRLAPARNLLAKALGHLARVPDVCSGLDVRRVEREAVAFLEGASELPPSLAAPRSRP